MRNDLTIDLSNLEIAEVDVLSQDGKGLPEFAASSATNACVANCCSCGSQEIRDVE
ncbi:MAG: hypothetical protein AAGM22_28075 [Acidobacteriota bacterium]